MLTDTHAHRHTDSDLLQADPRRLLDGVDGPLVVKMEAVEDMRGFDLSTPKYCLKLLKLSEGK